ncbi:MAG TPA: FN3 domain-containing metallophosphoesterase family protein [Clostridiales bacterium]|nr:FN3 domain-containing metallophosphoesterase family protein [Clostridiales bacterium]HQK74140.1 FN3 domain-containing metallophosphoesterase family protein [Clostridiales bacterium]
MKNGRIFAALLAAAILFSALTIGMPASAAGAAMTDGQWAQYWQTVKDDNTLVALTPGSDISRMNFSWHSGFFSSLPCVRISQSPDMNGAMSFYGRAEYAEVFGQRVNKVTVSGLKENTLYYYSCRGEDGFSQAVPFRTRASGRFKLLFVSDIQCSSSDTDDSVREANARSWHNTLAGALGANGDIAFVIAAGDNTNAGKTVEWIATLSPPELRSLPMATVVGNHDMKTAVYSRYVNNPNTFWGKTPNYVGNGYWFTYGDVLFICYNAAKYNMADQYALTRAAVEANPQAKWRVAVMHHDIYGTGGHADVNANSEVHFMQCAYGALFEDFAVDFVLAGHDHIYGRSYYMAGNRVVGNPGYENGSVTDPQGVLYFTASAAAGRSRVPDEPYDYFWLGYSYPFTGVPIYSTIAFDGGECLIQSFISDTGEQVDSFRIQKTAFFEGWQSAGRTAYILEMISRINLLAVILGNLPV